MTNSTELLSQFAVELDELQASLKPHPIALKDHTEFALQLKARLKAMVSDIYNHIGEPE